MKSTIVGGEIKIQATRQEVWDSISKFYDIFRASPGVVKSHLTSEEKTGVGATRHCDFTDKGPDGANVEERITKWKEGEALSIEIYEFKHLPGMKTLVADYSLRSEGDATYLKIIFTYSMKNIFFDILNQLMVKRANTKAMYSLLAGHKKNIETGENVTQETQLELGAVVSIGS